MGENTRMGELSFTTRLEIRGPAAAVVLDEDQVAIIGEGAKRFPVAVMVNGYGWRTSVARMGGEFLIGLSKAVREAAGVQAGDRVEVTVTLDTEAREVIVPEPLAVALAADPVARAAFESMSYTHRKEYVRWVDEARKDETRERRVRQAVEMMRAGKTRS